MQIRSILVWGKNEKKLGERPRLAAQANSVRGSIEEFVRCGGAGLSLRDITYNNAHASREIEIAVILQEYGEVVNQRS